MAKTPEQILRRLVDLSKRADKSTTAISMDEVFDDDIEREAWQQAWAEAKEFVERSPN